jgi:hypothetical protein
VVSVVGSEAVVDEEAIPFPVNGSNQVSSLFCHLESIGWRGKLSIRGGAIGSDAFRDTVRKCLLTSSNPRWRRMHPQPRVAGKHYECPTTVLMEACEMFI